MSIYVEILVRAPMDVVWRHTQTPAMHERWDLRFSGIEYLPRAREADPQAFRYRTRIGFGIEVSGEGKTVAERDLPDGSRVSSLRFGSAETLSIIREGRGYWKYVPAPDGIRFLTAYDYRTRFGAVGALVDRLVFRPLLGWATAWSFDRLRLWIEKRVDPAVAMRQWLAHAFARCALAAVFVYQGFVPKIFVRHADEIAILRDVGAPANAAVAMLTFAGIAEIALGVALLSAWRARWPAWLAIVAMVLATATVMFGSPGFFEHSFNPFALNVAVAALAAVDLLVVHDLPTAVRCHRAPSGGQDEFHLSVRPRL